MSYEKQFIEVKSYYPFDVWRTYELDQYTVENCATAERIFDNLISSLISIGAGASEKDKVACFKVAIEALNELNEETEIIETGEREEIV